jgi:hypothetical protein
VTYSSLLTIRKIHAHLAIMQLFFIVLLTSVSARSPPSIPIIERQRPHDYDSTDALKTSLFRCALPIKCPSSTSSNDPNPNGPPSPLQSLPVAAPFTDDSSPSDRVSWDPEAYKHMCRRFPPFQAKFHLILKPSQSIHPPITKPTSSAASIFLLSLNKDDVNTSAAYCGEYKPLIPVHFNGSRQPDPISAPNLRHSQHPISDFANHSEDTHAYFRHHLLPSTIHQFHGMLTQPFRSHIHIHMIQVSFLVSRFSKITYHLQVSFALYFQNSTNQAKIIRDMYSHDRNRFCVLPATTYTIDPDSSFSALCTLSLDSLIMFNNQKNSNAIQSDLDNDPIAYRIISTSTILVCYTRRGEFVCVSGFCYQDHNYRSFQLRSFQFRHFDIIFRVQIGKTISYTPSHCVISMLTSSLISGFRLLPATRFHFTLKTTLELKCLSLLMEMTSNSELPFSNFSTFSSIRPSFINNSQQLFST